MKLGGTHSPETRAKIRAGNLRGWDDPLKRAVARRRQLELRGLPLDHQTKRDDWNAYYRAYRRRRQRERQ